MAAKLNSSAFLMILGLSLVGSGCNVFCPINGSCKKDSDSSSTAEAPHVVSGTSPDANGGGGQVPITPAPPSSTVTTTSDHPGYSLTRIVPEVLSNNLVKISGYTELLSEDSFLGTTNDQLLRTFGPGLGGLDFLTVNHRDPVTKAQTILISRLVAMRVAKRRAVQEWYIQQGWIPGSAVIFTKCNIQNDRPGDPAFTEQIKEIFWKFYSRPPSTQELSAVQTVWQNTFEAETEDQPARAWAAILYAILASQEFWHI